MVISSKVSANTGAQQADMAHNINTDVIKTDVDSAETSEAGVSGYVHSVYAARKKIIISALVAFIIWSCLYPQRFVHLWLTPDQYGQLLFDLGNYSDAANAYDTPYLKAVAYYAAEDFSSAATLFSQYGSEQAMLAHANALAHSRNYLPAMDVYQALKKRYPSNTAVATNMPLIQKLIDENTLMSESQRAEQGDEVASPEDGPKSSRGDEREDFSKQDRKQLSADELLQNPELTEMWMRQVQRDPSNFLKVKFFMQLESAGTDSVDDADE